jgi:pathogenesis-related protein 1
LTTVQPGSLVAAFAAVALLPSLVRAQVFTQAEKETILEAHNQVRCGVNPTAQVMPPLVWDARLEATAQAWADACVDVAAPAGLIDHNPNRSAGHPFYVGENIYGSSGMASPIQAVFLWASESADYNLASNTCTDVCGHYTQLVWANTRRVGCARSYCTGPTWRWPSSIVCNYGPGGNIIGQRPYQAGSGVNGACDLIFQDGFEFGSLSTSC